MRQASRRSWRIGQSEPVQVVFMAYRNTLQADALKLVAQKLQSSLAVEGELPEDGLAAYGDDGDDLLIALARKIVAGEEDAGSVESVFEQARQVAAEAEALLVDEGWHAPEPEPVAVVEAVERRRTPRTRSRSARCSRGRSSWPGSQGSRRRAASATRLPRCPCSSGRSSGSRKGPWSPRSARPFDTRGGHRTCWGGLPVTERRCVRVWLRPRAPVPSMPGPRGR